jgi:hypothetical protein
MLNGAFPSELVQAVASVIAALVLASLGALGEGIRRNAKLARQSIGEANGDGTVVQMCERILAGQAGQDNRIARLEGGQHTIREDVARLTGRVDVLETRSTQ